jgi:hypothetical protein
MSVYTRSAATAKRLLTKYGQWSTLTEQTPGSYDPATASVSVTATGHTVIAAAFDFAAKDIDGTLIQQGDKRVYIAAQGLAITPAPGMTWTDANANVFRVITAQPLNPAGTAVIHTLQVRA